MEKGENYIKNRFHEKVFENYCRAVFVFLHKLYGLNLFELKKKVIYIKESKCGIHCDVLLLNDLAKIV